MESTTGQMLNPFEHALKRPDTYIGSKKTICSEEWVFDEETNSAIIREGKYNQGLFNIVREIISNAIDNKWRSEQSGITMKKIEVALYPDTGIISVWNDGYCIPVAKEFFTYRDIVNKKVTSLEMYPAEVYFGSMFSGTNYNDEEVRKTSGRNGMGAKAANVFSTMFQVEHSCPKNGKILTLVYRDNGIVRETPVLKSYRKKNGYTQISFIPDYKYFKYPSVKTPGMTKEFIDQIALYSREIAMITGLSIKFTVGEKTELIKVPSLEKYAKLYHSSNKMVSIKSPLGDECVIVENSCEDETLTNVPHTSFINGIRTTKGGIHVSAWSNEIVGAIVKSFNQKYNKKSAKVQMKTTAKEIYPYLHMFIRSEVDKPEFSSQTKDEYVGIKDDDEILSSHPLCDKEQRKDWVSQVEAVVKKLMKWDFIQVLEERILAKMDKISMKKESITTTRITGLGKKLDDANYAGRKPELCTLNIAEGLSAKALVNRGTGRDYEGAYALKGKLLNAINASIQAINQCEEYNNIKKIVGLRTGIDYTLEENRATLRYGTVRILTDADDDGIHIRGLLLIYFYRMFPSMIKAGIITSLSTAVVAVTFKSAKREKMFFYSNPEFRSWYAANKSGAIKKIDYYKGLGSIDIRDATKIFKTPKELFYEIDEMAKCSMEKGFDSKKSNARKEWISTMPVSEIYDSEGDITLSRFVDTQLIIYHRMTLRRALPCIWDGLKESQRKILYSVLRKRYRDSENVEAVAGAVKMFTLYHHGGNSLSETITRMGAGYVGSNNIPLFTNDGEFGTRLDLGDDRASARYIKTMEEEITRSIFPSSDEMLLDRMVEDGTEVEYKFFMPIIPMLLVNGSKGIACAYSTDFYNYNPLDLVERIELYLKKGNEVFQEFPPLVPWYRGFTGDIELKFDSEDSTTIPTSWTCKGKLEKITKGEYKGWWEITELPIDVSGNRFKSWLEYLESTTPPPEEKRWKKLPKKKLKEIKYNSTTNTVNIKIKPTNSFTPNIYESGNLDMMVSTFSLKNMVAIDENDIPRRFKSADEYLQVWIQKRFEYYQARLVRLVENVERDLVVASNRFLFVKGVVDRKININKTEDKLDKELEKFGLERLCVGNLNAEDDKEPNYDYLLSMHMRSMTKKKVDELENEKTRLAENLRELESTTPEEMWLEDLAIFRKAYIKFLKTRVEEV